MARGLHEEAHEYFSEILNIFRLIGDKRNEASTLGGLGTLLNAQGKYEPAVEYLTQAVQVFEELGDLRNQSIFLGNKGDSLVQIGRASDAIEAFERAIALGDRAYRLSAGVFRGSLALLLARRGEVDEARTLVEIGEPLVESVPEEHAKFLCKKGQIGQLIGDPLRAREALEQAQEIATELDLADDSEVSRAVAGLMTLLSDRGGL
jgi:tetratricopeptide (TPR) repeat protein